MTSKLSLDQAVWLALFAMLCITLVLQLDELLAELKKSRVVIFHKEADSNVIEGDFQALEFPSEKERAEMREKSAE